MPRFGGNFAARNCPQLPPFGGNFSQLSIVHNCHILEATLPPRIAHNCCLLGATLANSQLSTIALYWRPDWTKISPILRHIGGKKGHPTVGASLPPKRRQMGSISDCRSAVARGRRRKLPPFSMAHREFYPLRGRDALAAAK